jgi:hypothetical protein
MAHLWCDAPAPAEYLELVLCRDVYHCTPQELAQIPMSKLLRHLTMLSAEAKVMDVKLRH